MLPALTIRIQDEFGNHARRRSLFAASALIEISDSGPGLARHGGEAAEYTFQPLFTTKLDRTGLGLAFARRIVELHGGTLTTQPGKQGGAVFVIELPLNGKI